MKAEDAADIFRRWAVVEGFTVDSLAKVPPLSGAEIALIKSITEAGKGLLRTRQVQAILFNDVTNSISVLLRRTVPSIRRTNLMPSFVDDVPISYRQGVPNPIGDIAVPHGGPSFIVRVVGGKERYTCGSSISVGNMRDAGTLGCLVKDANGQIFGLSNNHVSGSCNFAEAGLPILAPGVADVAALSLAPFTIGFHAQALPFVAGSPDNIDYSKNLDGALFKVRDDAMVSSYQGTHYDTPTKVAPLIATANVEKVGRTTSLTSGIVLGEINGPFPITFSAQHYGFSGKVYFKNCFGVAGKSSAFVEPGDSGSLVTSMVGGERVAVGIVVGSMTDGTAPGGKTSIVLPIERILTELQVTLVANHNV